MHHASRITHHVTYMSGEYLSDREQEEVLRNWWRENWPWVLSGVAIGVIVLLGWNYWQHHQAEQHEAAARGYGELTTALAANDKAKIEAAMKNLEDHYPSSPYLDQGHLMLAQAHVNGGRFEMAATELQAVIDKSKDEALVQIAKLRLARVQNQLGHYDQALALLNIDKAGAFVAEQNQIRGDALLGKGDAKGAREAYQAALTAAQLQAGAMSPEETEYLQLKIQDLAASEPQAQPKADAAKTEAAKPDAAKK